MPLKGEGTYDGAGGSDAHPDATQTTPTRMIRCLSFFMCGAPLFEMTEPLSGTAVAPRLRAAMPSVSNATPFGLTRSYQP